MKSSKNKMCVQHIFDFVCTGIARALYAQSPYGIPVYAQSPCLLFLKPQKWLKITDFEENRFFVDLVPFSMHKVNKKNTIKK